MRLPDPVQLALFADPPSARPSTRAERLRGVDLISDPRLCGGEHEVTRHPAAQEGSTRAQEDA
jgi:hypothetical protein